MSTKDEVITSVMIDVGDRPTDAPIRALYETWFDDGYDLILARWPWYHRRGLGEIDVVAAGFITFEVPETVSEIRTLRVQGERQPLVYLERGELIERQVDLTLVGSPTHWYYAGWDDDSNVQLASLWPRPADDLTLEYDAILEIPLPLAGSDVIPGPRGFFGILREFIRAYSYENEGLESLAGAAWTRGLSRLERYATTKGISRPERKARLKEDGDLAHSRTRVPQQRFSPIVESSS